MARLLLPNKLPRGVKIGLPQDILVNLLHSLRSHIANPTHKPLRLLRFSLGRRYGLRHGQPFKRFNW